MEEGGDGGGGDAGGGEEEEEMEEGETEEGERRRGRQKRGEREEGGEEERCSPSGPRQDLDQRLQLVCIRGELQKPSVRKKMDEFITALMRRGRVGGGRLSITQRWQQQQGGQGGGGAQH